MARTSGIRGPDRSFGTGPRARLFRGPQPHDRVSLGGKQHPPECAKWPRNRGTLKVNVIMAPSSIYAEAARRATTTIPIVFLSHADPLGTGHVAKRRNRWQCHRPVASCRPNQRQRSGAVEGCDPRALASCRSVRSSHAIAYAWIEGRPGCRANTRPEGAAGAGAQRGGIRQCIFDACPRRADAVQLLSTPLFIAGAKPLAELAMKHKVPSLFGPRHHVEQGGCWSAGKGSVAARRHFRGQNSEGRQSGRLPGAAADQIRTCHQPQHRERDRRHDPGEVPASRRPNHRQRTEIVDGRRRSRRAA